MQVWIDSSDRVRQLGYQLAAAPTSGPATKVAVTLGFSDFGAALHLAAAPPASQTADVTDETINAGTTTN